MPNGRGTFKPRENASEQDRETRYARLRRSRSRADRRQFGRGAARIWSFGLPINWGILNYPATKANIKAAQAREQQSVAQYEKTVLSALTDVEDALSSYTKEKERQASLLQSLDANRKAVELARLRYDKGLSNFLDVLDARRSLYSSEDALTQSRATVDTSLVALYKALGGGW